MTVIAENVGATIGTVQDLNPGDTFKVSGSRKVWTAETVRTNLAGKIEVTTTGGEMFVVNPGARVTITGTSAELAKVSTPTRQCERDGCRNTFTPRRSTARYCSPKCRQRASRLSR